MGYIDGVIDTLENTRIPISDRGFLYGDSVYEVFRTYSGIPFLFDEHYSRLLNSARLIGMQINQSKQDIVDAVKQTILASSPRSGEDVYVRYQITRGEGPIDLNPAVSKQTRLVIIVKHLPKWKPEYYDDGAILAVPKLKRNSIVTLDPNIKGGNYLNNIMALNEAKQMGADDCLMLDQEGRVTECSNSNVWLVIEDDLIAPVAGNLDGLTRRSLIQLFEQAQVEFTQRPIESQELTNATECFLTSATREVMPVKALHLTDGSVVTFPKGGGGRTRAAMSLYSNMLESFISENEQGAWF